MEVELKSVLTLTLSSSETETVWPSSKKPRFEGMGGLASRAGKGKSGRGQPHSTTLSQVIA
jgi:hypothetical protein